MNSIAILFLVIMCLLMVVVSLKKAIYPILIASCYMTFQQKIFVAGLDFTIVRIIILVGWLRLVLKNEIASLNINRIDKIFLCWVFITVITGTILHANVGAFMNRMGMAYNSIGCYI